MGRLDGELTLIDDRLASLRPPGLVDDDLLSYPLTAQEQALLLQRDLLESALARLHFFLDAEDTEWVVRYPDQIGATLELVPLTVSAMAPALLWDAAELVVLSSAFLGRREAIAGYFGLEPDAVRAFASESPFALEQRLIEYRPVGALSKATLSELEPALFGEVAAILAAHPAEKGLVHAASYAAARRLLADLAARAPEQYRRVIFVESSEAKGRALDHHRASPQPTVLLSPSLREGVDLPDDFLRFQVITKVPYPDLGDPWTAARQARDPQWYALETAKALVQAYGRSCATRAITASPTCSTRTSRASCSAIVHSCPPGSGKRPSRQCAPRRPAAHERTEGLVDGLRRAAVSLRCRLALTRIGRASIMDARRGGRRHGQCAVRRNQDIARPAQLRAPRHPHAGRLAAIRARLGHPGG